MSVVKSLVDGWCDKRALGPLSRLLGPYLGFNGLTDGWGDLAVGLKSIRALDRAKLTPEELQTIDDLIRFTDKAIYRT